MFLKAELTLSQNIVSNVNDDANSLLKLTAFTNNVELIFIDNKKRISINLRNYQGLFEVRQANNFEIVFISIRKLHKCFKSYKKSLHFDGYNI